MLPQDRQKSTPAFATDSEFSAQSQREAELRVQAEVGMHLEAVRQFLHAIANKRPPLIEPKYVALAVDFIKTARCLDSLHLPGLSRGDKLLLELLVYDHEVDILEQEDLRGEIQKNYSLTDNAFERHLKAYEKKIGRPTNTTNRLKLEIQALMAEADPISRIQKRSEICSHYRVSAKDVEAVIASTSNEMRKVREKPLSLDDFLSQGSEAIEWIIPGLLPKGETALLTAMPKVGKTLLAVDLAFCLATGESSFLGESHKPAKVLFISVDESPRSTRAKLLKRGFRMGDPNIQIWNKWDISQMTDLESVLEDFRPDLTIIDSLKRITLGKEISENSAEFGDMIYELKETLERYGSAGLLIHHSNKNTEQTGLGCVRGNTSIVGAVWGVWQLDYQRTSNQKEKATYNPADPARRLTVSARDVQGQALDLELDPEQNSFKRLESEGDRETKSQADQILQLLDQNPYGLNGKAIAAMTGIKSVYSVLNRLEDQRKITSFPAPDDKRRMIYRSGKNRTHTHPPLDSAEFEPVFTGRIAETLSQYEEKIDHKLDHKHLLSETNFGGQIAETQSQQGEKIDHKLDHKIDHNPQKIDHSHEKLALIEEIRKLKPAFDACHPSGEFEESIRCLYQREQLEALELDQLESFKAAIQRRTEQKIRR